MPTKEKQKPQASPRGIAKYPWLTKPDTRFDEKGEYSIVLVVDPNDPDTETWLKKLETDMRSGSPKGKNLPFSDEIDKQSQKPTGMVEVKFKSAYKPSLFDSKRQKLPDTVNVGSGSLVRVSFIENWYEGFGGGMNLYLQAVQVIDLKEYKGRDPEALGFEEEEGFEGDQPPEEFSDKRKPDELPPNWKIIHGILENYNLLVAEEEFEKAAIAEWFVEAKQSTIAFVKKVKLELRANEIPF